MINMCGIVGIMSHEKVSVNLYEGLIALQHRGQDSAGITTYNGRFNTKKGLGLVRDIFSLDDMVNLSGSSGIAHVRYPTVGSLNIEDVQPFIERHPYGMALAHNGNVYNFWELKKEIHEINNRLINSNCDAEVLLNLLAYEMSRFSHMLFFDALCQAVKSLFSRAKGGYSVVVLVAGKGLVAFRDPHGIRPLVWGKKEGSHIFASENTMFEVLGYSYCRDVEPGEVVFIDFGGQVFNRRVSVKEFHPCIFEYVYFARPDAYLNGVSVHRARLRMGQNLAHKIKKKYPNLKIDVVIPSPQTANIAALSCAYTLGVRYSEGLVKNHFIGRTFIMPGEDIRKRANKYKLSAIDFEIRNKNVLVVDDSIVRGTVARHVLRLMRKYGAKKVYLASASPPLRWPDLYGIDLPTTEEYVAHNRTIEQIQEVLGADLLIYQDLEDLIEAVTRRGDLRFTHPHCAYFNGQYPTEEVTLSILREVEERRKKEREKI